MNIVTALLLFAVCGVAVADNSNATEMIAMMINDSVMNEKSAEMLTDETKPTMMSATVMMMSDKAEIVANASTSEEATSTASPYPTKARYREFKFESCSFDNIDSCARAILFYGDQDAYMARNEREMRSGICPELKGAVSCASQWSRKCLKVSASLITVDFRW